MREYIMQFDKALYDEKSGEAVFQPIVKEEVIRCKDCKYTSYEPCKDYENVWICNRTHFTRANGGNMPNDYCSYGERKEE